MSTKRGEVQYLRSLLELIGYSMVPPNSPDPEATMLLDGHRMDKAARRLEHLLGMLEETGYLDSQHPEDASGGAVTTGLRFLYYHELGHLSRAGIEVREPPNWIVTGEEELVEELVADQFALTMLVLELRSHPILQPVGFSGVALALSFVALKEFAENEHGGGNRGIKHAVFRMKRLLYWAGLSEKLEGISKEAIATGEMIWKIIYSLFARVKQVPSPVFSLFIQTADRPIDDWRTASNHLLRWCTFGDRAKVLSTVRKIRDSALSQAEKESRARKVLKVIDFLLDDTRKLEPTLGLREKLDC